MINALQASNRNCGKTHTSILEHDKKNNNKNKNNKEKYDIERSNNTMKNHVKMRKSIIHQNRPSPNDENVHEIQQKNTRIEIVGD